MRGNRRSSSVSSYKSTIGFSIFKLFLMTTVVGLCITKIIVGGEYISACRSEPLLPVYVVISGCLPVFLSPLRGSSFTGHGQHADKQCRLPTYHTAVLVFGVIANLSWLVFGTILLSKVFMNGHRFTPECDVNDTSNASDSLLIQGRSEEDGTRTNNGTSLNNLVDQMDLNAHLVKGQGNDSFTKRTTVRPPADMVLTSDSSYRPTPSDVPLLETNTLTSHTITSNNSKPSMKSQNATVAIPKANHPVFSNKSSLLGPPHSTSQASSRSVFYVYKQSDNIHSSHYNCGLGTRVIGDSYCYISNLLRDANIQGVGAISGKSVSSRSNQSPVLMTLHMSEAL